jgi:uncharacterized protein
MAAEITLAADIRRVLEEARTIAVLGAHEDPAKPASYVPAYLHERGYRVLPVNPVLRGKTLFGEVVRETLADIGEAVDIVDVFRRAEQLPAHLPDLLAMAPRPRLVWLQLGIRNDAVARALIEASIDVVQDRCTLADHRHFGLGNVR